MASRAELFFREITDKGGGAFDFLATLADAASQTEENEWRDFKEAGWIGHDPDTTKKLKKIWSENLGAFANAGGGVLIFGIKADNHFATGISLVPNAAALRLQLLTWANDAAEPPVANVEVEAITKNGDAAGFVVCLIPASSFSPHCSRWAERDYYLRFQDGNEPCPPSILRRLFYPQSAALVVPGVKAKLIPIPDGIAFECVVDIENTGSATALNCYIEPRSSFGGTPYNADEYWKKPGLHSLGFETPIAIHPGRKLPFLRNFTPKRHYLALEDVPEIFKVQFIVFAKHSEPVSASCSFSREELLASDRAAIPRTCKVQPLTLATNYLAS